MIPCRSQMYIIFNQEEKKDYTNLKHAIFTGFVLIFGATLNIFYPHIISVLGFLGGSCATFISLVFPGNINLIMKSLGLLYFLSSKKNEPNKKSRYIVVAIVPLLFLIGMSAAVISIYQAFTKK